MQLTDENLLQLQYNLLVRLAQVIIDKCSNIKATSNTIGSNKQVTSKQQAGDSSTGKLLLYLHGGGHLFGNCYQQLTAVSIVAVEVGARVVCPDYRLAPEHPFPAGLEDVAAVYTALLTPSYGYQPENIAFIGDSSGGGMLFALLLLLKQRGQPFPGAAGAYSPWVELSGSPDTFTTNGDFDVLFARGNATREIALAYTGGNQAKLKTPLVSPIYGDYSITRMVLPPILIQAGSRETLLADSVLMFRKLRSSGQCALLSPWDAHELDMWVSGTHSLNSLWSHAAWDHLTYRVFWSNVDCDCNKRPG
eukprot:gene9165-9332_t